MGKHKFNSGRVCEFCAGHADFLSKGENGKFLPCPEAPEEGKTKPRQFMFIVLYLAFAFLSLDLSCLCSCCSSCLAFFFCFIQVHDSLS